MPKIIKIGHCFTKLFKKLEIWGKAQRESARRPNSYCGKLGG